MFACFSADGRTGSIASRKVTVENDKNARY